MSNQVTAGLPQKFKASFSNGANPPVTPTAQATFTSADQTKIVVSNVGGTFDQFLATFVGGNPDGTPAQVSITCALPGSPTYSSFSGPAAIQSNPTQITLVTLTAVP